MTSELPRRRLLTTATALTAATVLASPGEAAVAAPRRSAALVVHNARVVTGERGGMAEAVAVGRDGRIVGVGGSGEIRRRFAGRDTEVVDAGGGTVMSGVVDGHAHPVMAAVRSLSPSLGHRELTVGELRELVGGFLAAEPGREPDGWLVVEDWNPVGLLPAGTVAHHSILDALPTRRPVVLVGGDGHTALASGRALDLAGITAATPDPPGGEIVRGPGGEPTGLLKDEAKALVTGLVPDFPEALVREACGTVLARAAAQGVTTVFDAAVAHGELGAYAALARAGRLPQRVAVAVALDAETVKDPAGALEWAREVRAAYRGVPGLSVGAVKVFLDGVIEHPDPTAALLEPYLDGEGRPTANRGELWATPAEFARLAVLFDRRGWQVHTHAIGDRAVRTALDGYEAALRANGRRGNRHTITHLQLVHPADLRRFRRLGVVANMQLQWAMRDTWTVDALLPYIGEERHRRLYPARGLERAGAVLAGGSDWPVDPLAVWNQIRTAVDREGEGATQGPLHPELEGISRAASLRAHTSGAAYQLRMERRTGKLTPGRQADLIVLDRDVTRVPVREISGARVRLTLVGGVPVYEAESAAGKAVRAGMEAAARTGGGGARHSVCAHGRDAKL
ncbi:hypothetical protein GCM10010387_04270 [Streptomyces inusitatus]|uniref:Amidohydrolase 3 domain-containing protein n=1 Tax=Streptomyces inusitatus TaxID=68221 RepID=A0A918PLD1_9ACTN|nr:amidohydrolase [Streptomyces inusitatus]GGZ15134.1 hypothetical protein GCM10010387_04270 [Streptomyces inusitatus]